MRRLLDEARSRGEDGYAAVFAAIVTAGLFMALAAIGVDLSRVYVEVDRVQKAADAAALAGVTYMPNNLSAARSTAIDTAAQNGFPNSGSSTVTVSTGDRSSQLKVTITSTIDNSFAAGFGVKASTITRSAVADYTPPSPIGSPCNTFGNEPNSEPAAAAPESARPPTPLAPCAEKYPNFWAAIEGPETDKVQGDRYQAADCIETGKAGATYGCNSNPVSCNVTPVPPGTNCEYRPEGYFFILHVEPEAVNSPVDVQIYDPAFVFAGNPYTNPQQPPVTCAALPTQGDITNGMNPYATKFAKDRYGRVDENAESRNYCPGDSVPTSADFTCRSSSYPTAIDCPNPVNTSFALRGMTATGNPNNASVISGCVKQFGGSYYSPSKDTLTQGSSSYNAVLAKLFHQWVSLCTFTPAAAGDYYIQVRTNVSLGGNPTPGNTTTTSGFGRPYPTEWSDNTAVGSAGGNTTLGEGSNGFALRAVPQPATNTSLRTKVSISGFERMPVFQNATGSTATFNLIKTPQSAAGQNIYFSFYDAADGSTGSGGNFQVLPPLESMSQFPSGIPDCRSGKNDESPTSYTALTGCKVGVQNTSTDGQVRHIVIPIPKTYTCTERDSSNNPNLGGCWFRVQLQFSGSTVTDFTTWSASIEGDPVRLIK